MVSLANTDIRAEGPFVKLRRRGAGRVRQRRREAAQEVEPRDGREHDGRRAQLVSVLRRANVRSGEEDDDNIIAQIDAVPCSAV